MNNDAIAGQLGMYSKLLALHGGNSFQVGAYQAAAFNINKKITQPLAELNEEELRAIPQIGKSVVGKILEISETGTFLSLTELMSQTPVGVAEMLNVRGLGPKKVQIIWKEMEIDSIGELLDACRQNRLANTKGFGAKTQEQILAALEFSLVSKDQLHWAKAHKYVQQINIQLLKLFTENDFSWVGAYARKMEVVNELHLLVNANYKRVLKITFQSIGLDLKEEDEGFFKVFLTEEFPLKVSFVENLGWETYLAITPKLVQDNIALVEKDVSNEAELFEINNVAYILPELREPENLSWMSQASDLIVYEDLKGCVHNHTIYSDGLNTLKEMADACIAEGWQYFGVSDHSKTASYAGGLKESEVERQWQEIDTLNRGYDNFKIFKGIESDILSDGSLDYEEVILKGFDFVVASIHSNLKMDEEKAMMRLIKAIENPYTRILGHLTGRLLLLREGYPVNHSKIIDACAANNVAIELNAHPYRLDMDWRYIHEALNKGVMISVNPDAHVTTGLLDMKYGINAARKGGLYSKMCLNSKSLAEFEAWVDSK